jgi:hypothetical protein
MENSSLSPGTKARLARLFAPGDQAEAEVLLSERCGRHLPGTTAWPESDIERIQFAALKVSGGSISALVEAVRLANSDWRNLLVAAGFANDPEAHKSWSP